jgi:hypothetical protein
MARDLDGVELVGAAEIAPRLGLARSRQVLDLRLHRLGFPQPVGRAGGNLLWSWPQVARWAEAEAEAEAHPTGGTRPGARQARTPSTATANQTVFPTPSGAGA